MGSTIAYGATILLVHGIGLFSASVSVRAAPALPGMGVLASTLGLRHGFDADHIAVIDNAVRRLVHRGHDAHGVGFYFSLGHSTVVLALVAVAVGLTRWAGPAIPRLAAWGGPVATEVSAGVLLLLGLGNVSLVRDAYLVLRETQRGQGKVAGPRACPRGLVTRLAGPLVQTVTASWHVYPVGFLFGLGFDTASEIALLALSAQAASRAMPLMGALALPLLFAAGMCLVDTADGVFMTEAYRWAVLRCVRRASYNLAVTGLSVVAALSLGLAELTQSLGVPSPGVDGERAGILLVALCAALWVYSSLRQGGQGRPGARD